MQVSDVQRQGKLLYTSFELVNTSVCSTAATVYEMVSMKAGGGLFFCNLLFK